MATDWNSITSVAALAEEQLNTLGFSSVQLASTYSHLADLYFLQDEYDKAEKMHWKVLGIRQKVLGEWHADTAATLQNLAELYEVQDRYAEAQRFYQWAVSAKKSAKLRSHSDTLDKTQQISKELKLPQLNDLQPRLCKVCKRQLLDAEFCMYCTQTGFDANALIRRAQKAAKEQTSPDQSGPVNMLTSLDEQQCFELNELVVKIGRHPSNQIVFPEDRTISRHHATISYIEGVFVIKDNKTLNGTYLNGKKIDNPIKLTRGDVVTVGKTNLKASFRDEA